MSLYLDVKDLVVIYDRATILNKVTAGVNIGESVSLVGPNGAGKTTFLRAITGLVKWEKDTLKGTRGGRITFEGSVKFDNEEISQLRANEIVQRRLILCPERGRLFGEMTVKENLIVGAFLCKDKQLIEKNIDKIYNIFSTLKKREKQTAGTLSGGERSMLAIGRALMSNAKVLLLDEPSFGLAPRMKEYLFECLKEVQKTGITMLLVEQDVSFAFDLATRHYVFSRGKVIAEGTTSELLRDKLVRKTYLGL